MDLRGQQSEGRGYSGLNLDSRAGGEHLVDHDRHGLPALVPG